MAIKSVYRGYVCMGYNKTTQSSSSTQSPQFVNEYIFGDFSREYDLKNNYRKWLSGWTKLNPGEDLPLLKIVEVLVNENNIDVYYDNTNSN